MDGTVYAVATQEGVRHDEIYNTVSLCKCRFNIREIIMRYYRIMMLILWICSAWVACSQTIEEQHALPPFGLRIPQGYEVVYETDFSDPNVLSDFRFTDPDSWRLTPIEGTTCLELYKKVGAYKPPVRSPHAIALLATVQVGDFILEVDVESTNITAGAHRDSCFFFGLTNPSNFYYVHIATSADPHAHNVFLVNNAPRTPIATFTTQGVAWGVGLRHRVRIERTLADGAIRVFFNDLEKPVMEAKDETFGWGYVGVGSFDDTTRFYALRLYAPEKRLEQVSLFEKKEVSSKSE